MQITPAEIAETLAMVSKQHLDIRTITLGLNLRGCTDSSMDAMARKVYDRMTTAAERLVPTAEQLERCLLYTSGCRRPTWTRAPSPRTTRAWRPG